ncbi:MAG: helix-turn-helix domain-containing protein [Rhodospirillaceae bacterium]|nr:helix-turn-helix domain-containing protein [Rhodospirillaceae bacterium]
MIDTETTSAPNIGVWHGSLIYAKYRDAAVAGFQAVPNVLLKHQDSLGLSTTDLVVLLNVLMHWWYPEQKPFPRSTTIAKRMGLSQRAVQRALQQLQERELLVRERSEDGSACLNPEPLVAKLEQFARDDVDFIARQRARIHERQNRDGELGPYQLPQGRDPKTPF